MRGGGKNATTRSRPICRLSIFAPVEGRIETGAGTYQRETHIGISFMRLSKSRTSYWRLLNSVAFLSRYAT